MHASRATVIGSVAVLLLTVFVSNAADAQRRRRRPRLSAEERRARELYDQGDTLYENGDYTAAIDAFQEAYDLAPRPLLLYNLANAQERAGEMEAAVASLRLYLPDASDDERTVVENRIENIETRLEEVAEAERARAVAEAAASAAAAAPPQTVEPPPGPDFVPAIALFSVAGALGIGAAITGGITLGERDTVRARCVSTTAGGTFCPRSVEGALATDEALSIVTDVLMISAVVAAGVGVYFLIDAFTSESEDSSSVSIGVELPGRVSLRGSF